jgi:hypothetical protein
LDQRTVFIAQEAIDRRCNRTIVSVTIGGPEVTVIAQGSWPALSADGTRLAYLADAWARSGRPRPDAVTGPVCRYEAFVIRDLQSGLETVAVAERDQYQDYIDLDFSPDGEFLSYARWADDLGYSVVRDLRTGADVDVGVADEVAALVGASKIYLSLVGFTAQGGFVISARPDVRFTNTGVPIFAAGRLAPESPCSGARETCLIAAEAVGPVRTTPLTLAEAGSVKLTTLNYQLRVEGPTGTILLPGSVYQLTWPAGTQYIKTP